MKKLICIIVSFLMLTSLAPTMLAQNIEVQKITFVDVPSDSWYKDSVDYCVEKGYFKGTSVNRFTPDGNLTREQFTTVLFNFAGYKDADWQGKPGFADTPAGEWYSPSVRWSRIFGITSGAGNGNFGRGNAITREQFCTLLMNYAKSLGIDTSGRAYIYNNKDAKDISSWAIDGMSWAVYEGIMTGTSKTTLSPKGITTRAQAAVLIKNFDNSVEQSEVCKHTYECTVTEDADCDTDGSVFCHCPKCEEDTTLTIKAIGHNFTEHIIYESTCSYSGKVVCYCNVCGKGSYSYDLPKLSHIIKNGICQRCYQVIYTPSPAGKWVQSAYSIQGGSFYQAQNPYVYLIFNYDGTFSYTTSTKTTNGYWSFDTNENSSAYFKVVATDSSLNSFVTLDTSTDTLYYSYKNVTYYYKK